MIIAWFVCLGSVKSCIVYRNFGRKKKRKDILIKEIKGIGFLLNNRDFIKNTYFKNFMFFIYIKDLI